MCPDAAYVTKARVLPSIFKTIYQPRRRGFAIFRLNIIVIDLSTTRGIAMVVEKRIANIFVDPIANHQNAANLRHIQVLSLCPFFFFFLLFFLFFFLPPRATRSRVDSSSEATPHIFQTIFSILTRCRMQNDAHSFRSAAILFPARARATPHLIGEKYRGGAGGRSDLAACYCPKKLRT